MKRKKIVLTAIAAVAITIGSILYAADHVDSPTVAGHSTDITDVYVFQAQDANNLVFVANTQGLLSPGSTGAAAFDPNTLIEFKIDNNADNVEDLVIQAIYKDGKMNIYGPIAPSMTGTMSKIEGAVTASVNVTPYSASSPNISTGSTGIKVFAGPRDDPFFFDLTQFKHVVAGDTTAFRNPGTDTFAGLNVLSVVVEVPKSLLNASTGKINVWLTTRKKVS
jgi:hypothetical protein